MKSDLPASVVVFLVAIPLCLGIAMASGAPLYAGLISGILGGIVVGALSKSPLGVSGPAAGLAVIVLNAISDLGGFEVFLLALVLAGIIQLTLGFLKAGVIAYFFPSSVIHGMLAGIGVLIFAKQIPHAFGYDKDPEGDFEFIQLDGQNTLSEVSNMWDYISPGVMIISFTSLAVLILWETAFFKRMKFTNIIQGPLVAVILGIILNIAFTAYPPISISGEHLVKIPIANNASEFLSNFSSPDFSAFMNPAIYTTAIVIAIVASLETLLCLEASDKLDPYKRTSPVNRELKAQGVGNILAGLLGGLPVTQVIVRSSVNAQSGGKTKASAVLHGILLLISILFIPGILNYIPLGTLAAILLVVGYKLAKPALFKKMFKEGPEQFIPFLITIAGIILTDLLIGIALGMIAAIFIILRNNFRIPFRYTKVFTEGRNHVKIAFSQDITFLNKASIRKVLAEIPNNTTVEIDASRTIFMHRDVYELLDDFETSATSRDIEVHKTGLEKSKSSELIQQFKLFRNKTKKP